MLLLGTAYNQNPVESPAIKGYPTEWLLFLYLTRVLFYRLDVAWLSWKPIKKA